MLRIDPATGAVSRVYDGRGSARTAATVLALVAGLIAGPPLLASWGSCECGAGEAADEGASAAGAAANEDGAFASPPSGGAPGDPGEAYQFLGHAPMAPAGYDAEDGAAASAEEVPVLEALDEPGVSGAPRDEDVGVGDPLPAAARALASRQGHRGSALARAVAACLRGDHVAARAAYDRLGGAEREQLVAVCLDVGTLLP